MYYIVQHNVIHESFTLLKSSYCTPTRMVNSENAIPGILKQAEICLGRGNIVSLSKISSQTLNYFVNTEENKDCIRQNHTGTYCI